jgi:hypothetical protein
LTEGLKAKKLKIIHDEYREEPHIDKIPNDWNRKDG